MIEPLIRGLCQIGRSGPLPPVSNVKQDFRPSYYLEVTFSNDIFGPFIIFVLACGKVPKF